GKKTLGVAGDGSLSSEEMVALGLPADAGGFRVKELESRSAGARCGLQVGDVILSVNGRALSSDEPAKSLHRFVAGAPKGVDVPIVVQRAGKSVTLTARWD